MYSEAVGAFSSNLDRFKLLFELLRFSCMHGFSQDAIGAVGGGGGQSGSRRRYTSKFPASVSWAEPMLFRLFVPAEDIVVIFAIMAFRSLVEILPAS